MRVAAILLMLTVATMAHAVTLINPAKLQTPREPTCIDLKEPLTVDSYQTIFKWHWTYTLARGPYIAEKVDTKGTYYRAPPGGLSELGPHSPKGSAPNTYDGGFYIPNDPSAVAAIYEYRSIGRVPVQPSPGSADCSSVGYIKDPSTSKINFVAFGVGGAIGGATGATIARSTVAHSNLSYGQAAGAGAAGGLIGGLVVGAIVNHEMGKIVFIPGTKDEESLRRLRNLAIGKVLLRQLESAEPSASPHVSSPSTSTQ